MAISKERLRGILSGDAQRLCSMEANKKMDESRQMRGGGGGYDPDPSSFNDDWDNLYLSGPSQAQPSNRSMRYTNSAVQNSNLPDAVKQSMINEQIDVSALDNSSVISSLGIDANQIKQRRQQQRQQQLHEQSTMQMPQQSQSIDYTIIKAIVSECLKEQFSKQLINESNNLQSIVLKGGTITLYDNSGNAYQAKLQKIKKK